ncbi:MAG: SDR family oxidoreductase [Gammaproteobacteria bacterium]|nr:SDR family oxidoreductase [Gammaproteobacteria bacterium]
MSGSGDLAGTACVVTGSTRGIGLAIARGLARRDADVVVSARTDGDVRRVAAELAALGNGRAAGIACDVRHPEECRHLIDSAVARFGRLDVLVNNAGWGRFAPIDELSFEDWRDQIDTNLGGVFHCSRAAVPHLAAGGGGWIINIGSLAGRHAFAGGTGYNASKFGLLGMTEAMMLDLRHRNIRVSLIMPGSVNTGFRGQSAVHDWKLDPRDVARAVEDLLAYPRRALPSRIELRPSRPTRKRT